jgi:hypothetical protein
MRNSFHFDDNLEFKTKPGKDLRRASLNCEYFIHIIMS